MTKRSLSAEQFASHLQGEGWGFSMRAKTGRVPHTGNMVSKHGTETIVPGRAQTEDVKAYIDANASGMNEYFGAWVDTETDPSNPTTFLDQSVRKMTKRGAVGMGREHAQRAYYNVDADKAPVIRHTRGLPTSREGTLFEDSPEDHTKYRRLVSEQARMETERSLNQAAIEGPVQRTRTTRPQKMKGQQRLFRGV